MGKKNSQLHLVLETSLLEKLKQEARDLEISLAKLCRQKLNKNHQLNRIELMVEQIKKRVSN